MPRAIRRAERPHGCVDPRIARPGPVSIRSSLPARSAPLAGARMLGELHAADARETTRHGCGERPETNVGDSLLHPRGRASRSTKIDPALLELPAAALRPTGWPSGMPTAMVIPICWSSIRRTTSMSTRMTERAPSRRSATTRSASSMPGPGRRRSSTATTASETLQQSPTIRFSRIFRVRSTCRSTSS